MSPRMTDWVDTVISLGAGDGAQATASLLTGLAPVNLRGATVIRSIIELDLSSASVAGAWGVQRLDFGIGVADQEAHAAGVLPDPLTSGDKPARGWMYRTSRAVSQNGIGSQVLFPLRADIRGARKIENGEVYYIFNNNNVFGTAFTVQVMGLIRLLIKLA